MLYTSFRRSSRTRLLRVVFAVIALLLTVDLLRIIWITTSSTTTTPSTTTTSGPTPDTALVTTNKPRVFIASIHWNNEAVLRSRWNDAVVSLAETLGVDNVYVSVYESGSWDDSKGALRELDVRLGKIGVQRTVRLDEMTHADELARPAEERGKGWIETSRKQPERELRRIPYLARLRNLSLEPLWNLEKEGVGFDKVLFLNDVVFTPADVLNLINTREGHYAAACSLDFSKPPAYYDTFALRDFEGYKTTTSSWPYFRSSESRNAMLADHPVPVRSCWNGMVVFDSSPFYNGTLNAPSLSFRGIPDTLAAQHLEGSECCLIHYDNPLSKQRGVYVNPRVRVGYDPHAYEAVAQPRQWPGVFSRVAGLWANRIEGVAGSVKVGLESSNVKRRIRYWQSQLEIGNAAEREPQARHEPGVDCLINEMHVLVTNGWAHV
ncbi:MAG: hypothetical protein M4579_000359 [Chaenotheca gracillima]|nr:MAG: hypothetical protein M4579_000359 [Chaenotheca gracillima]